jgi:hypothetical protein
MSNHEEKPVTNAVHMLMAFKRTKDNDGPAKCLRVVVRDYDMDLFLLEEKCKRLGGEWRIHKTINARDTEKARIWLMHRLIDDPNVRGYVDSIWRTALLQKECIHGEKKFLLDIDTKDAKQIADLEGMIDASGGIVYERVPTTNGWHFITNAFDTRGLDGFCSLIRDGYVFIKKVGSADGSQPLVIMTCKCGLALTYDNILHVEGNAPWFQCPRCHEEYVAG